jgi:alpha-L-fucosidase
MLQNNRLFRPWPGDFSTPEQHVPPTGLDYDWEVCMTMNTSWGYKHYDQNWKSAETLIRMLVDIASKGGNLLLNVGPTAEGLIPQPSVERLKAMGEWMDTNSESIYGTGASPFFKLPWGRCTSRETDDGSILYLHVFQWPEDHVLRIPGISARIRNVSLLSEPARKLSSRFEGGDLLIDLPETMPDPVNTVVVVQMKGSPTVVSNMPSLKEGRITLPADFADIHNPGYGTHAILSGSGEASTITNWVDPRVRLEWMFSTTEPGRYLVRASISAADSARFIVETGKNQVEAVIVPTGGTFSQVALGEIEITEAGESILSLKPIQEGWRAVELGSLVLEKQ